MREIKFRGKVARDGKWIYGDLAHIWDEENGNFIPAISQLGDYTSSVEPETIGQFTGLKDKNGKEIYEGDVLKCIDLGAPDFTVTGVIEWDEDLVAYSFKYMDFRLTEYDELEVLGSIYENPELIKETTKYLVELNETLPLFTGNSELSGAYKDVKKQYKWIKEIKKSIEQEGGK